MTSEKKLEHFTGFIILFKGEAETEQDEYVEALKDIGYESKVIPVLSFEQVPSAIEHAARVLQKPHAYSGIIFTSPRSVECLETAAHMNDDWQALRNDWNSLYTFVVGEATAKIAREKLRLDVIGEDSGNSNQLAEFITTVNKPGEKPLLFPCGQLASDKLASALISAGISVETLVVYDTKTNPNIDDQLKCALKDQNVPDYFVFFSPSGVQKTHNLIKHLLDPVSSCKLAAIGPTTKDAIIKLGYTVAVTAQKPSAKSLAEAILLNENCNTGALT